MKLITTEQDENLKKHSSIVISADTVSQALRAANTNSEARLFPSEMGGFDKALAVHRSF